MIRLSKSIVGRAESLAIDNVLVNNGYLGMGEEVRLFENEIENYLSCDSYKVVCVNSGTAALHLAIESVTNPGDEVLVPSYTYISTYQAITAAGCVPISCEISDSNLLIDLRDAESRISPRTKVILPVWYASNPEISLEVYAFSRKHNLRVIEDAAHAFGCTFNGKKIGAQGDIICFSFDGIKNITSGEGGAIVSSDMGVINYVKDARLLGVQKDTEKRYRGERSWDFDVTHQGYRYHMSNIFAAIGRVQLKRLDSEFAPKRQSLAKKYFQLLSGIDNISLISMDYSKIVPHIFPILINYGNRDKVFNYLLENGIQCGIHYKPNHILSKYKSSYNLKVTEKIYTQVITLPLHPELAEKDIEFICTILKKFHQI